MSAIPSKPKNRRCIVLHAPDREPASMLLSALTKRHLDVETTPSVHRALAALTTMHQRNETGVLVLSDPETITDHARCAESVERFAPRTLIWSYTFGATPPLGPYAAVKAPVSEPVHDPEPVPTRQAPKRTGAPELRLSGSEPSAPTSSDILDPDELDALLKPYDK